MPFAKPWLGSITQAGLACMALCRSFFRDHTVQATVSFPEDSKQWRSRLALASLLFSAWWGARAQGVQPQEPKASKESQRPPQVTCYRMAAPAPPQNRTPSPTFIRTLRAAWLVLDADKGEAFRQKVMEGVRSGQFTRSIGEFIALAYQEIAFHKARTSPEGMQPTCYKMTPLGGIMIEARESALKQIELLRKASNEHRLDDATVQKVKRTLARDLDALKEVRECSEAGKWDEADRLSTNYHQSTLSPSSQAMDAAAVIAKMEEGR